MGVLVTTDTGSKIRVTCVDGDTNQPLDLTANLVNLRWQDALGTVVSRSMVVSDALNGVAEYQFTTGEIIAPRMRFEVEIEDAFGNVITSTEVLIVPVREKLA